MLVYHVETNIENRYCSVFHALDSLKNPQPNIPDVPRNTMPGEDTKTPRICVAPSIEECIMGCTVSPFLRCCEKVWGLESFAGLPGEAYPIIVSTFDVDNPYVPSANEVPDSPYTGELWLLEASTPVRRDMYWLTPDAITAYNYGFCQAEVWPDWDDFYKVESVNLLTTEDVLKGKMNHPWLNRRGHILDSLDNYPVDYCQDLECLADTWPQAA